MTGRSDVLNLVWADAEVESIAIDYDAVRLAINETATGNVRHVRCEGYIGYQVLGFWDEVVVETATIVDEHEFLDQCLANLQHRYPDGVPSTGQSARNEQSWSVLSVRLSDGAELLVAANRFSVE